MPAKVIQPEAHTGRIKGIFVKKRSDRPTFEKVGETEIIIPVGYNNGSWINVFRKVFLEGNFYCFDDAIMDDQYNLKKILVGGRELEVLFFQINHRVTVSDCVDFANRQGCLLLDVHGLTLLHSQKKNILPIERRCVSPGKPDEIFNTGNLTCIASMSINQDGDCGMSLISIESQLTTEHCLVLFRELF
jgi:hypothetical protein